METTTKTTIRGIVLAADWKPNGEVTAVDIAGYDERKYRVIDDKTGMKLRALLKEKIVAEGLVNATTPMWTIRVVRFWIDTSEPKRPLQPRQGPTLPR